MTIQQLEKENKELNDRFLRLLACLYPNSIGQQDIEYIMYGKKEIKND